MYTSFFGLRENPFNLTPDPRYLFLSPYHKKALDHLLYGINERKGFIAITGGVGTGKTTLCRELLNHLDGSTKSALILNSFLSDVEILESINHEFGIEIPPGNKSKKDHIDALNHFLLKNFTKGGNALLLIDEAQNLSNAVLEQIRMISNLETEKEKLIQIVLVGQSELKTLLSSPSMRQLNERITVRYVLNPLDSKDLKAYLEHRLVVAGSQGTPGFTKGALKKIYGHSGGNPRRINAVCDRALLIAYSKDENTISPKIVKEAIRDISGEPDIDPFQTGWFRRTVKSPAFLMTLLIILAGLIGWNFKEGFVAPVSNQKTIAAPVPRSTQAKPPKPKENLANPKENPAGPKEDPDALYLDQKTSLAGLFNLFALEAMKDSSNIERNLGLVSFQLAPKYYTLFKRPFRIRQAEHLFLAKGSPRYLLIREMTPDGAMALDAQGNEHKVSKDFILRNWGENVSWLCPGKKKNIHLARGTSSPGVFRLQETLGEMGYPIELTGAYDDQTFNEVKNFQRSLGLKPDGIVGPKTMALLYQMHK